MKIIKNKIIPFGDFLAINLFDYVFTKRELKDYQQRHEEIHSEQMRELLYIPFYVLYVLEFIIKFPIHKFNWDETYRSISFEREAYKYQDWYYYLNYREKYAWRKFIFNKSGC